MISIEQGVFDMFIKDVKNFCAHPRSKKARELVEKGITSFEQTILKAQDHDQRPVEEQFGLTIGQMLHTPACMDELKKHTRDNRKISCIRWVRHFTYLTLKEAKEYVEANWHNWK